MRAAVILVVLAALLHATRSFRPHSGEASDVAGVALAFGFLLLAAFHAGSLFARVRLPKIVAYLVTGIVTGPHLMNLVSEPMIRELELVNGVAVCLIALTAGGELDLERFRPLLGTIRALTVWAVAGTCVLLAAALFAGRSFLPFLADLEVGPALAVCAMLGVALSAQSPAVVMAMLSETRADGPVSRTILGTVVVADLVVILLFGIASAVAQAATGAGADPVGTALGLAWELPGSILAGALVAGVLALYLRYAARAGALFVLLLCLVVSEVGRRIHLDPLVVMLSAGVIVQNAPRVDAHALVHAIESASLPVYLVFFALAGATLHLDLLVELGIPAVILVLVRAAGFRGGALLATREVDPMIRKHAWVGLLPQAGLALALALIVRRTFPEIGDPASALVLAVIAINELVMPLVLRHALLAAGEADGRDEPEFVA